MSRRFTRTIEDFTCGHCGASVRGNGYTNHCPVCLWSKHVDVNPGDRTSACQGLMEPIAVVQKHGVYILVHRCRRCGALKRNKVSQEDSVSALVEVMKRQSGV